MLLLLLVVESGTNSVLDLALLQSTAEFYFFASNYSAQYVVIATETERANQVSFLEL